MLATATTARPGCDRWTEVIIYRLGSGSYVLSRVGRSTIAHRPTCSRANARRMLPWLEAGEEGRVHRVPCLVCQPVCGDRMDPHTLLERTVYRVLQAWSPQTLSQILLAGVGRHGQQDPTKLQGMTADLVRQLRESDENFRSWWLSNYRR